MSITGSQNTSITIVYVTPSSSHKTYVSSGHGSKSPLGSEGDTELAGGGAGGGGAPTPPEPPPPSTTRSSTTSRVSPLQENPQIAHKPKKPRKRKFIVNLPSCNNSYSSSAAGAQKQMKIRLGTLKKLIREAVENEGRKKKYHFGGSHPEEDYDTELLDDPSYRSKSVYVPDDIKNKIDKWAADMGLSTRGK
jgi:hypothetical protein